MVTFTDVKWCLWFLFMIGAMVGAIYLMYRGGKNQKFFTKESSTFFNALTKEYPSLETIDSHAVYINLCGRYKGFPIFVSHARGKGGMPQRMRFYVHHDLLFKNRARFFPKKNRMLKAVQSGFKKEEVTSLKGDEYLIYYDTGMDKIKAVFLEALDKLNQDQAMFALTCERIGVEFQCFGYVHERQPFIHVLDTLTSLIEKVGTIYPKVEPFDSSKPDIALSDKKYSKITLQKDRFKIRSDKGVKTYLRHDILFMYETDQLIEIYLRTDKKDKEINRGIVIIVRPDDKIELDIKNITALDKMRAWLF